jgi:hypothetical protein
MSKLLISVLAAIGVLSACTTGNGLTYTAHKVNIAGQPDAYRVNCTGVFQSQKTCMAEAAKICKGQQVVPIQALDSVEGRSNPREITFSCAGAPSQARSAE